MTRDRWTFGFFVLAMFLILALLAAACGEPEPPLTEGKVIDRVFTPEHWEDGYETESYMNCGMHYDYFDGEYVFDCRPDTRQVYEAQHVWRTDAWKIQIHGCVTDDEGKKKCRDQWVHVGENLYNECLLHRLYHKETGCLPQ